MPNCQGRLREAGCRGAVPIFQGQLRKPKRGALCPNSRGGSTRPGAGGAVPKFQGRLCKPRRRGAVPKFHGRLHGTRRSPGLWRCWGAEKWPRGALDTKDTSLPLGHEPPEAATRLTCVHAHLLPQSKPGSTS